MVLNRSGTPMLPAGPVPVEKEENKKTTYMVFKMHEKGI